MGRARRPRSAEQDDADLLDQAGVTAEQLEAFVDLYAGASSRGADLVDGHHAAPRRGRRRAGHRQRRPGPRQRRPRRRRPHADPRPLRACRAAPRWAPTPPPSRAARRSTPPTPRRSASSGASRCPSAPGRTAPEMVDAAGAATLDVLWSSGGNFLEVLPDPPAVTAALDRVPLRVHQDVVVTTQMLVDGRRRHPAAGRHPLRAGGRRHRDHHGAAHHLQPGDPAPGRRGAQRVAPLRRRRRAGATRPPTRLRVDLQPGAAARDRRGRAGLRRHRGAGHHRRPGAVGRSPPLRRRRSSPCPTGGRRFTPLAPTRPDLPAGSFTVATRRGKQFNSMVHASRRPAHRRCS